MTSKVVAGVAAAVLMVAAAASAQSLGDVAKQEEARRKTIKAPGKVYTNESLHSEPPPSTAPTSSGSAAATSTTPADTSAAAAAASDDAAGRVKDEAAWRKRVADARSTLDRSRSFADALQSRINALTTDFTNRDDPAQRAQIGADRDKALAELNRVKKEMDESTKTIANIQEDARKAGVPAGWVR